MSILWCMVGNTNRWHWNYLRDILCSPTNKGRPELIPSIPTMTFNIQQQLKPSMSALLLLNLKSFHSFYLLFCSLSVKWVSLRRPNFKDVICWLQNRNTLVQDKILHLPLPSQLWYHNTSNILYWIHLRSSIRLNLFYIFLM